MSNQIEELRTKLQADTIQTVEDAAVRLSEISREEPERIEPAIEELQTVVRNKSGNAPGKAVSALTRYGCKVDRNAIEPVETNLSQLLQDTRFNQLNALLAVTALRSTKYQGIVQNLTESGDTSLAAAATLAFVSITDSDLEWLPIQQKHIRQIVSDGMRRVQSENPEILLYMLDDRCGSSGQEVSARDHLLNLGHFSQEFASTVTRFANDYPEEGTSSLHIGVLSRVASKQPELVADSLKSPIGQFQQSSGQTRRQYLWTFANVAEQSPEAIDEEIIKLARRVVRCEDHKQVVQAFRILGATDDSKSQELIRDRIEGSHQKVQSAGEEVLESLPEKDSEGVNDSPQVDRAQDRESSEKLIDLRRKAEKAAQENPVRESASQTSKYNRSSEIKDYAKARASGFCECCSDPAPFENTDGEPYLEIHHVDELGKGGPDSPDRVVAICPTCHRRIHYGSDGEEINSKLRDKLESGLSEVGSP